jgi:hypothetical protein
VTTTVCTYRNFCLVHTSSVRFKVVDAMCEFLPVVEIDTSHNPSRNNETTPRLVGLHCLEDSSRLKRTASTPPMMFQQKHASFLVSFVLFSTIFGCEAFSTIRPSLHASVPTSSGCKTTLYMEVLSTFSLGESFAPSSMTKASSTLSFTTVGVSAATLDPTSVLSDIFSGILGTPLILAVPILAALGVAGLIAFFIISYASPEVDDD